MQCSIYKQIARHTYLERKFGALAELQLNPHLHNLPVWVFMEPQTKVRQKLTMRMNDDDLLLWIVRLYVGRYFHTDGSNSNDADGLGCLDVLLHALQFFACLCFVGCCDSCGQRLGRSAGNSKVTVEYLFARVKQHEVSLNA